ncbi:Cation/multidrug efflux pump [Candidatus Rhodobacter oscarellae]|uniref:Cation/multidrug efflux pump n=1 Tax=Candidatus Rhodobacter oscarellae TaxID=1675527 RepID=A0A0J9EC29_9RHOB|nr:hypothetical protein [Candidatus Rhodobacter lobularis]KMW60327.1 Cation/multidrug efflux pump [Candidatus Rhodobacter lobularis]
MNFVRLIVLAALICTVIYVAVAWYLRSITRERLEKEWAAAHPGRDPVERSADVEAGVEEFKQSLGYRALWLIYVVPVALIAITWFTTN